jgi:hypothetical protein
VVKKKKEKALAEHVACHPEDVGRTIEDFNWVPDDGRDRALDGGRQEVQPPPS